MPATKAQKQKDRDKKAMLSRAAVKRFLEKERDRALYNYVTNVDLAGVVRYIFREVQEEFNKKFPEATS